MAQYATKIPNWPENERPRERLVKYGPGSLSDTELLAIMLRTGSGPDTAIDLARHLLKTIKGFRGLDIMSVTELCSIKGIGIAKTAQVKAALEIGKRLNKEQVFQQEKLTDSEAVYLYLAPYLRDLKNEVFYCIFMTGRNTVIRDEKIFEGTLDESVVAPREIVHKALNFGASAIILVHNHPSGDPTPSKQDKLTTEKIIKACQLFDIKVLDHIIIGKTSYYSFAGSGII